jgi:hypothetical protein
VRDEDTNPVLSVSDFQARRAFAVNWFFDEENAVHPCTARQEMLRALKYEIPSQVRQADNIE